MVNIGYLREIDWSRDKEGKRDGYIYFCTPLIISPIIVYMHNSLTSKTTKWKSVFF